MAIIETSRPTATGLSIFSLLSAIATWNDTRATRKALGGLTDRELDDIGLCRGDIESIARRA